VIVRWILVCAVVGGVLGASIHSFAQQQAKVWRVGMLETTSIALNAANVDAFRQAMRALGYVEERNLIIEYRSADGRGEPFADLAKELVGMNVDLIVTRGTPAALAVKNVTRTVPVVMSNVGDPDRQRACDNARASRRKSYGA
jgi:ABC-type uncharacterized transport system substrate-binding protein